MNKKKCLYCYQVLPVDATDFHPVCSRKFFGTTIPPALEYSNEQMQELAKEIPYVGPYGALAGYMEMLIALL